MFTENHDTLSKLMNKLNKEKPKRADSFDGQRPRKAALNCMLQFKHGGKPATFTKKGNDKEMKCVTKSSQSASPSEEVSNKVRKMVVLDSNQSHYLIYRHQLLY